LIYFIGEIGADNKPNGIVKIGYTDGDSAKDRLASLQSGNPRRLRILKEIKGDRDAERLLHELFAEWRLSGEWFASSQHAARLITYKKVVSQTSFVAALGSSYAERARKKDWRDLQFERRHLPRDELAARPKRLDDATTLAESVGNDGSNPPSWLTPVIDPPEPDDDGPLLEAPHFRFSAGGSDVLRRALSCSGESRERRP
jgi:Meiotically up-regulated gene 113